MTANDDSINAGAQAAEALLEREARLKLLVDHAPAALAMFDREMRYLAANRRWVEDYGLHGREIAGRSHYEVFPDLPESWKAIHARALAGESVRAEEDRFERRDGRVQWLRWEVLPWRTFDGSVGGIVIFSEDITGRKETEERLRRSEDKFYKAFNAAPLAFALSRLSDGKLVDVNDEFCRITGYAREEVLGRTTLELGIIDASDRERITTTLRESGAVRGAEAPIRAKGGRVIDGLFSAEVVNVGGEPLLMSMTADVTERKRTEEATRRQKEQLDLFFKSALDLLCLASTDGRFLRLNPEWERTLGYPLAELEGAAYIDFVHPDDVAATTEVAARLSEQHDISNFTNRYRCRDGSYRWIEWRAAVRGDVIIAAARDITERRAAEAEQRRLEQELSHLQRIESLGRLAGGVAHDINNVLTAIMGVASLLESRHRGSPGIEDDANDLLNAAIRGRDLVRSLRDFSRKELDSARPLDLNELVRREGDLLERTTLKKVAISVDLAPSIPFVFGEASSITNALMNLCVNACDAMPGGGHLRLATRDAGDGVVELVVEDDGEGMPPEVLARALEPFFTTKDAGSGTGLGLSQVYGTMKAHGGTVELESAQGRGTRVVLRFPAVSAASSAPDETKKAQARGARRLRVLAVDDEQMILLALSAMLEALGHEVQTAAGGWEALRRLELGMVPDLVILDLNMPEMDGVETLTRIRARMPEMPVMICSGYADDRVAAALGAHAQLRLLHKPFTVAEIRDALADWPPSASS